MSKLKRVTFILGAGRSGTTLLRVMLAGHPDLFAPPELFMAVYDTMAIRTADLKQRYWVKGGLRRAVMNLQGAEVDEAKRIVSSLDPLSTPEAYAWLQDQLGDRMLVDKCPPLAYIPQLLPRVEEWFDSPRYIWIVRHPGAVIRSFQNMPMAEMMFQGFPVSYRNLWYETNRNIRDYLATIPEQRWTRVRFEDLVREPRAEMERVCATIGVPFHEAVLDPYEGDRMREGPKGARAIGDPQMATRRRIQPELANKWLDGFDPATVNDETRFLAKDYGYDLDAMPRPPIARVGEAMKELFDVARTLEQQMQTPVDLDNAEGRRFLLRMLGASIDTFVEFGDAERPRFHDAEGPHRKMFADCSDADYHRAPIRLGPGRAYRLWGRIPPGTCYVGVLLYGRGGRVGNCLADSDLQRDADGRFEVRISTEAQEGTWLKGDGDENAVMVRQYYADRGTEAPMEVNIELVGEPAPLMPLDANSLADNLGLSIRMLKAIHKRTVQSYEMVRGVALNQFVQVPPDQLFPTPDNRYLVSWYRFGRDQLLVVRGQIPKARYFGLSLCNAWMESLDYLNHQVNLNHRQIETDADGRFEVVLSHSDPGIANWLDVAGHDAGYLLVRCLLLEGDLPALTTQVMYVHEWERLQAERKGA
jgi:hypothetical protein